MEIEVVSKNHKDRLDMISYTWMPDKSALFITISFTKRGFDLSSSGSGNTDDGVPYKSVSFDLYDDEGKEIKELFEIMFIGLDGGRFYYSHNKRDMDIMFIPYRTYEKVFTEGNLILNSKEIRYGTES